MRVRSSIPRRQFLRTTGLALATAAGTPLVLPARVRAAEGATAPGNRIAIGIIGLGKMCQGHLGGLLGNPEVQIVGLCDVESLRLEQARARVDKQYADAIGKGQYKGCAAYRDFRDLLARPDLDAVVIATPEHWHGIMAVEACRSGKDVYCEKPLTLTLAEARAVADTARRYGRIFQTGSQQRSERTFRFACELVRNGRIGKLHTVHVNVGGPSADCYLPPVPTPESLDWDLWIGPAPMRPYHPELCPLDNFETWPNWRGYRDFGGGGLSDMGAHHFDIAQWGMGTDDTGPVAILQPDGKDLRSLAFRYANGVTLFHGGGMDESAVDFIGSEGRVAVNRGNFLKTEPASLKNDRIGPSEIRLYESANHMDNWLQCIRTRRQTICPAEVGCRSVSLCLLGSIAYALKRNLEWDPRQERFSDPEANRWLARPMRAPWHL